MVISEKLKVALYVSASLEVQESVESYLKAEYDPSYRMLLIISEIMNFKYEIIPFNTVGKLLPNGTWTGVIGMLNNLEVDMTATTLLINEERSNVLHYSYPFRFYPITFIIEKPKYSPQIFGILKIFSVSAWLTFLSTAIFMALANFLLMKHKHSLIDSLVHVFATCLKQPTMLKPWKASQNVLITTWMVGGMFLGFCYTSVLLSFLTFPSTLKIRNMQELANIVEEDGYKCLFNSFIINGPSMLVNSNLKPLVSVGKHLQQNPNRFGKFEDFLHLKKGKIAFFNLVELIPFLPNNYFVSEDYILDALAAWAVPKQFCCKEQLDDIVHRLMASGLYAKIKQDKMFLSGMKLRAIDTNAQNYITLTLKDFYLPFLMLLFGQVFSFAVFIAEVMLDSRFVKKTGSE